jgi:class 3 adenylate cyclase
MEPNIQYATTEDGVAIAYCEAGEGTPFVSTNQSPWSNIEAEFHEWEWHRIMASRRRLIRFDNRGSGSSQRNVADYSVEAMALDIAAVVDALKLDQFALYADSYVAPAVIAYAARNPERVSHLILHDGFASGEEYFGSPRWKSLLSLLDQGDWELFTDSLSLAEMGWNLADVARRMGAFARGATTLDEARRYFAAARSHDVTRLLPQVRVPTLVLQARGAQMPTLAMSRRLAAAIPGARLRILESDTHWSNEMEPQLLAALDEFIGDGGQGAAEKVAPHVERIVDTRELMTVLFTDIESHTEMMSRLGDVKGRGVLREHDRIMRELFRAHGGSEIKGTGDGFMTSFGSATRALECAIALQRAFARYSEGHPDEPIRVRIGLNAGEPVAEDGDLFGASVTMASRIMSKAAGGEIFASNVVRELCGGKSFMFADRGESTMRGFEDSVRLYEVRWRDS